MIRFSAVGSLASRLVDRVRGAARKAVSRTEDEVRGATGGQVEIVRESRDDFFGFSIRLTKAIVEGAPPWDIKPGLLARARKYSRDGTPYVDVPVSLSRISNRAESMSVLTAWGKESTDYTKPEGRRMLAAGDVRFGRDGPILFRRVSLKSPAYSWIHPGFGGEGQQSKPRFFGTGFGPGRSTIPAAPDFPGDAYRGSRPGFPGIPESFEGDSAIAAKAKAGAKGFREAFFSLFRRGDR